MPAALFAVMEKAQRSGADGKRTRRKPGQQTEAALLTAATVVRVRLGLVVAFVLWRFCFREKTISSEMTAAAALVRAKGQTTSYVLQKDMNWHVFLRQTKYKDYIEAWT